MEISATSDFRMYWWIHEFSKMMDVSRLAKTFEREYRRLIERRFGVPQVRTDDEIVADLSKAGEACSIERAYQAVFGIPQKRWNAYVEIACAHPSGFRMGDKEKDKFRRKTPLNRTMCNAVRWFTKRYGISIDKELNTALKEVEIDLDGLKPQLPWSPMIVKAPACEILLWEEDGEAYATSFYLNEDDINKTGLDSAPQKIQDGGNGLKAWLCVACKGEASGDLFELKIGDKPVALLPRITAQQLIIKHKIADDAERLKGSWIRRGHFRMTKSGPTWINGSLYKKDESFVHKVHAVTPKKQDLFT